MPNYAVQRRRGTTAQHGSFTGLVGELSVDTDKSVVVVHDGSTAGGRPMLREDGSNFSGTIATDIQQIDQYLAMGMQYIVYLVDCYVLKKGYMEAVDHFRLQASISEKN